ncbi:MAG: hypothetical protein Nk1A_4570 [Endomicrobiia bacterium]|nr:MAG: hypothetical protein Nk1A_4570 [Endomicrobiia bacterium]
MGESPNYTYDNLVIKKKDFYGGHISRSRSSLQMCEVKMLLLSLQLMTGCFPVCKIH